MKNAIIFMAGGIAGFGLANMMYNSLFKKHEVVYEDDSIKIVQGVRVDGKRSSVAQVINK